MVRSLIRGVFLLCLCLGASLPLLAQSGQITGTVTDPSGSAVPNADVSVVNQATLVERHTKTNDSGIYTFPFLDPGQYRIVVHVQGFNTMMSENVVLTVGQALVFNVKLKVGTVSDSVTVEGGTVEINTTDASVSTVVDRQFAENLPMNGRSFQSLLYLAPGVSLDIGTGRSNQGQFVVDGQRASSNYWMVDGVSGNIGMSSYNGTGNLSAGGIGAFNILGGTNSLVSVDAMQEFRIQTSTYAPEFGRTPGGQISIVTRSGTNQFHGTVFDYFRNTVLDATDWFANSSGLPKAAEQQNDFGGVVGGPIIKDRTFFFFSYEGLRLNLPEIQFTTVPDMTVRENTIAAMQPWIQGYPIPNPNLPDVSPGLAPFNASYSDPASVNSYSIRVDHELTKSVKLFGRYSYSPSNVKQRGNFSWTANNISNVSINTQTATVGTTWTKSATVVDEARFNYSLSGGAAIYSVDTFGGAIVPPSSSLFPAPYTNSYYPAFFEIIPIFGTDMDYNQGKGSNNVQHQYNIVDTVSWQIGAHALKFGVDYRRLAPYASNWNYAIAPLFFLPISNLEQGISSTYILNQTPVTFLFHNLSLYAQDTWRISPRLTLTYGLRWDVDFTPSTENNSPPIPALTGFSDTDVSNLALAPVGTSPYPTRFGNFAPRLGAAYQISQSPNWGLVFRGGFGVFYDLASTEVGNLNTYGYPWGVENIYNIPFPTTPADAIIPPIIPPDATQGGLQGFDPHLNVPYVLEYSAAIEQSLGKTQTIKVSYVGSVGRRLLASEYINNPNANYLNATIVGTAGSSNYNGLQVQFQRRMAKGLQALGSYTWSHSIDDGSYGGYTDGTFANINANRGDSDYDIRNVFSGALTYDVPVLSQNAFAKAILGGWSTENIVQVHSAPPVNVVDGAYASLKLQNASVVVRPDVVPGQPLYLYGPAYPGGKALNPAAFTSPPTDPVTGLPTRQGDLSRNTLRAFGLTQWDFAVHRDFPIPVREGMKLQFRAEMFNVLNHPNFSVYDTNFGVDDAEFGKATQMLGQGLVPQGLTGNGGLSPLYSLGGPRSIQLALKLFF